MNAYSIIELKYNDALPIIELLNNSKIKKALDYLMQWDFAGEREHSLSFVKNLSFGPRYKVFNRGKYIIALYKDSPEVILYRKTRNTTSNK